MSKNEVTAFQAAPAPIAAKVEPVTLEEFCMRLSKTDKRVELISGFHYTEVSAGRTKDAESAFKSRFDAFATKPVI